MRSEATTALLLAALLCALGCGDSTPARAAPDAGFALAADRADATPGTTSAAMGTADTMAGTAEPTPGTAAAAPGTAGEGDPNPAAVAPQTQASWLDRLEESGCTFRTADPVELAQVAGGRGGEWDALALLLQQALAKPGITVPAERDLLPDAAAADAAADVAAHAAAHANRDTWPFESYYFIDRDAAETTGYLALHASPDTGLRNIDELVDLLAYIAGKHPSLQQFRLIKFQRTAWPGSEQPAVYLTGGDCTVGKDLLAPTVPFAARTQEAALALLSQRLAQIGTLLGAAIDGGQLVLFGTPRTAHSPRPLTLDDMARAYRSVRYQCDCPESQVFAGHACHSAFVSIDPDAEDPFGPANVVLAPCLRDSRMGQVFLDADILIKEMASGYDLTTGAPRAMPHGHRFESDYVADIAASREALWVRYWFFAHPGDPSVPIRISAPDQRPMASRRRARSAARAVAPWPIQWIDVGDFHLTLGIEVIRNDGQILSTDEPALSARLPTGGTRHPAHAFAAQINRDYTTRYAPFFPELSELDNAVRLIEIMGWIDAFHAEHNPALIALLERLPLSYQPTPRQVAVRAGASVPVVHSERGTTTVSYLSYGGVTAVGLVRGTGSAVRATGAVAQTPHAVVVVRVPHAMPGIVQQGTRSVQATASQALHSERISAAFLARGPGSISTTIAPANSISRTAATTVKNSGRAAKEVVQVSARTATSRTAAPTVKNSGRAAQDVTRASSNTSKAVPPQSKAPAGDDLLVSVQPTAIPTRIDVKGYDSAAPIRGPPPSAGLPVSLERGRITPIVQPSKAATASGRVVTARSAAAPRAGGRTTNNAQTAAPATYRSGAGFAGVGLRSATRQPTQSTPEQEPRQGQEHKDKDRYPRQDRDKYQPNKRAQDKRAPAANSANGTNRWTNPSGGGKTQYQRTREKCKAKQNAPTHAAQRAPRGHDHSRQPGGVRAGGLGACYAERHPARILADRLNTLGSSVAVGLPVITGGPAQTASALPLLAIDGGGAQQRQLLIAWIESATTLHLGSAVIDVSPRFAAEAHVDEASWQRINAAWPRQRPLVLAHWPGSPTAAVAAARALWLRRAHGAAPDLDPGNGDQPLGSEPLVIVGPDTQAGLQRLGANVAYLERGWHAATPGVDPVRGRLLQMGGMAAAGWQGAHAALDAAMGPGMIAVQDRLPRRLERTVTRLALLERLRAKVLILRQDQLDQGALDRIAPLVRTGLIATLVVLDQPPSPDEMQRYLASVAQGIRQGWSILNALTQTAEARALAPVLLVSGGALQ